MSRKRNLIAALIIILLFSKQSGFCNSQDSTYILKKVISKIESEYITNIGEQELALSAIKGIVGKLDSYSQHLTEEEFAKMRLSIKARYNGIGIEAARNQYGEIYILSIFKGSPAENSGLQKNDIIIRVNGENNLSLIETIDRISNHEKVILEIMREKEKFKYSLSSSLIHMNSVEHRLLDNDILYLKVLNFAQDTNLIIEEKIERSKNKSLILDLRDNYSGIFNQAISIAEIFLPSGSKITTTKSKKEKYNYKSKKEDYIDMPMVVLINSGTASAAEVLSAALQDNKRAKIIGEKSFGKGSIQSIFPLREGYGAIKITTAMYYTPSGHSIDSVGIIPDIEIKSSNDSDNQLGKAIDLLRDYK